MYARVWWAGQWVHQSEDCLCYAGNWFSCMYFAAERASTAGWPPDGSASSEHPVIAGTWCHLFRRPNPFATWTARAIWAVSHVAENSQWGKSSAALVHTFVLFVLLFFDIGSELCALVLHNGQHCFPVVSPKPLEVFCSCLKTRLFLISFPSDLWSEVTSGH